MDSRKHILVGERFTRLLVLAEAGKDRAGNRLWKCLCDCGNLAIVATAYLRRGTKSCGCLGAEKLKEGRETSVHGMTGTPEYNSWKGMKARCENPKRVNYADYGGRGLLLCEGYHSFTRFLIDIGEKPQPKLKYSVDRKNNQGHYSCGQCSQCLANGWLMNVRWATRSEQNANQRPRGQGMKAKTKVGTGLWVTEESADRL